MIKKALIFFLVLIISCGNAFAQAERITLDLNLQTENDTRHVTADLVAADGKMMILSDLFPSYAVSLPFSNDKGFGGIRSACLSFINLFQQDRDTDLAKWFSSMNPMEERGIYAGDVFDYATQRQTITVNLSDLLSKAGESHQADFLSSISSLPDFPATLIIHGYDSGKFFSISGMREDMTCFTVSCDFSRSGKKRLVWGYPDHGHNYYWSVESTAVSTEKTDISCILYSDPWKKGFRSAVSNTPVLSEQYTIQALQPDQIQIQAEITPGNHLEPFHFSCRIGEDITAEVQLGDEEQPAVSVSIMENPDKINFDGCQQISMEDLLSPATAAAFYAEISANALPLLFFLMQIMPQNLLNLLINLN